MGGVAGNLVPQTLASNDGDFIADPLVGLEVQGQLGVVTFDYNFGGFLDGLRANATHLCCDLRFRVRAVMDRGRNSSLVRSLWAQVRWTTEIMAQILNLEVLAGNWNWIASQP